MAHTKRNWPHWIGKKFEFIDKFDLKVERGQTSLPVADCCSDGSPFGWREIWGKGKKLVKKKRTRAIRRQNKKIDFD